MVLNAIITRENDKKTIINPVCYIFYVIPYLYFNTGIVAALGLFYIINVLH